MSRPKAKSPQPATESFAFEITDFEPSYMLSVNHRAYEEKPLWEHTSVVMTAVCLLPKKVAGRTARFELVAERDAWTPTSWQRDHDWRPAGVGLLELPPPRGSFYAAIPFESMPTLMTALAHGLYRYILLHGPELKRGKSLCGSFHLMRAIDLDDY